jgi:predicted glycoside hydrolase/deacetylase ChbG (UPF0249 family)
MTLLKKIRPDLIIVNADDFGVNEEVNRAILKSFELGIISSTTLLVNMPGFLDAVEIVNVNSSLKGNVGLHLNLIEGFPLSDLIKKQKRFCNKDGMFAYKRNQSVFSLHPDEKRAIGYEVKAQVDKAQKHGIPISHIDSHHSVHTEWGISQIILNVLADYKIKKIRIARNMGVRRNPAREIYKYAFNSYLKFRKFKGVDLFGDLEDFLYTIENGNFCNKKIEIMVHPIVAKNGAVMDFNGVDIKERLKCLLEKFQIKGYGEL